MKPKMNVRSTKVRFAAVFAVLMAVSLAAGPTHQAAARNLQTLAVKVETRFLRSYHGTMCAYVENRDPRISLSRLWQAGDVTDSGTFRPYGWAQRLYKSKGKRFAAAEKRFRALSTSGANDCRHFTGLRFRTSGFVSLGLAGVTSRTASASVHSTSASSVAIAGLYGISADGRASAVISALSRADAQAVQDTRIKRVYEAPDGDLVIWYRAHPSDCILSRVVIGETFETCVLMRQDLPASSGIIETPWMSNDATEPVQFDSIGNVYANIQLPAGALDCVSFFEYLNSIMQIRPDGSMSLTRHGQCNAGISSWSVLDGGGVVVAQICPGPVVEPCSPGMVSRWKDGVTTTLAEGVIVTPNGIHTMSDGKVVITNGWPSAEAKKKFGGLQGGVLVYDDLTGTVENFLNRRGSGATHSVEDVLASCNCGAMADFVGGGVSDGSHLLAFGTGRVVFREASAWPVIQEVSLIATLYPEPTLLTQFPVDRTRGYNSAMSAVTPNSFIVASSYLECQTQPYRWFCENDWMWLIDRNDGSSVELVGRNDGIGILSLTHQTDSNLTFVQGIRKADKKFLIGTINESTRSVTWSLNSKVDYPFESLLLLRS